MMDEFDYSVHISEQDWHSFFQECEECDLLPPSLAGLEDSGMSDMDDAGGQGVRLVTKNRGIDMEVQIDGPPDCEGSPVELYLSKYGLRGPEQVLSGSEEDLHSEAINVFFERLKGFSHSEDCMMQTHQSNTGGKTSGSFGEAAVKAHATVADGSMESILSNNSEAEQRKDAPCRHDEHVANDTEEDTCIFTCSDPQLFTNEEEWLQETVKEGMKWMTVEKCVDLNQAINLNSGIGKAANCTLLSGSVDLADPSQHKGANSQLVVKCNSAYKGPEADQGQSSSFTPRRRRRRKKRVSSEPVSPDHGEETPFHVRQGESDDESYVQRCGVGREPHTSGDCSSGTVSEALHTLSPQADGDSCFLVQTRLLPGDADTVEPTMVDPNSPKATTVAHSPRTDLMSEKGTLTGQAAPDGEFAIRGEFSSPQSKVCNTEEEHIALQSEDTSSVPTNGDNVGNHLQLNSCMSLPKEAAPKSSEHVSVFVSVGDTAKPAIMESLLVHSGESKEDELSVLNHTATTLNSHASTTSIQQPELLLSDHTVCTPDSPHSQAGEIPTISDPKDNRPGTAYERKSIATVSCATFPELTKERAPSACYNSAEKDEGLTCMSHDRVTQKQTKGHDSLSKESLSGKCNSEIEPQSDSLHVVKVPVSHQSAEMNAYDMQMKSGQSSLNPSGDAIKDACSSEPSTDVKELGSAKAAISDESVKVKLPLNSQNENCTEEVCPFYLHGSKEDQNAKDAESLFSATEARNEVLSIKVQTNECQSLVHAADPTREFIGDFKLESNPSIIITTSEEEKDQTHYANMPPHFLSKEHESVSAVTHSTAAPTPESLSGVGDAEPVCPATSNQPTLPLYAISSFWNEMEKLTINDILRLRLGGQDQHPGLLLPPDDCGAADTSDAADSGYFAHLDDSKPDPSSGDMSLMSDFDEEFAQLQLHDLVKAGEGSRDSPYPGDDMWENQLDATGTATGMEDVLVLCSETALPPPFYRDSAQQCFRKMCKNVSVQNLQSFEARPFGKIMRNPSLHSVHAVHLEDKLDYEDPFDRVDTSSPVFLSDEEEELESPSITFSEIIQYLFGTDEPELCAPVADNPPSPSYLEETGTSIPEMYDHFFSEFEAESFIYPFASSGNNDLVPIFSCSRSATRTHHFPEVYDYFFPDDSSGHSDEDEEHEQEAIQVSTWNDRTTTESHSTSATSDTYDDLPQESSYGWNFLWKNPLWFRRAQGARSAEPQEGIGSWALTPVSKTGNRVCGGTAMGPFLDPLLLGLESSIFRQLAQQQKICSEIQTAVADPRLDTSLVPLKQADMCLVCIAFASWVLKSVNPQGADTWKAALLANISALSAIRYLRRYMRDEATKKPPLRQIEPA